MERLNHHKQQTYSSPDLAELAARFKPQMAKLEVFRCIALQEGRELRRLITSSLLEKLSSCVSFFHSASATFTTSDTSMEPFDVSLAFASSEAPSALAAALTH